MSDDSTEKTIWGYSGIDYPNKHALKFSVKDGEISKVEAFQSVGGAYGVAGSADPNFASIQKQWMSKENRLNFPMKRAGARGEGKWERISWDEAISISTDKLKQVIETYGNEAVFMSCASAVQGTTTAGAFGRLLSLCGGYLNFYNNYSFAQIMAAANYMFGPAGNAASSIGVAKDAGMILAFGTSPAETGLGGITSMADWEAFRSDFKGSLRLIDCRKSESAMANDGDWLAINPGTDAALVAALAYEIITKGWADVDFLHKYCVGFDEETMPQEYRNKNLSYKDYILGQGYDKIAKTPEWAQDITGISAEEIRNLAREMNEASSVFVMQGWSIQRRSNGEWASWSVMTLPCLLGQIGLPGTSNAARDGGSPLKLASMPRVANPVKTSIPCFMYTDAIAHPEKLSSKNAGIKNADSLKTGIKYIVNYGGNSLTNQHSNINRSHEILSDETACEFILGIDVSMSDSLNYCDVILPDIMRCEQPGVITSGMGDGSFMYTAQDLGVEMFERKTAYEMCALIAEKMGVADEFTQGKTEQEWVSELYASSRESNSALPSCEQAASDGVYTVPGSPRIALAAYRQDPVANPLATQSGKIELFSAKLLNDTKDWEVLPGDTLGDCSTLMPIPAYIPEWYGAKTATEEYPLMISAFHTNTRVHTCMSGVSDRESVSPQVLWINPADATARGIAHGEKVVVENEFGSLSIVANVTDRIISGVVALPEGAAYAGDGKGGIDAGGCINVLTTSRPSALAKGNPQHTNICQVSKLF